MQYLLYTKVKIKNLEVYKVCDLKYFIYLYIYISMEEAIQKQFALIKRILVPLIRNKQIQDKLLRETQIRQEEIKNFRAGDNHVKHKPTCVVGMLEVEVVRVH